MAILPQPPAGATTPPTSTRTRKRPDLCEGMGHPGVTYNAAMDMTWCLCGAEITFGNTAVPHVACCDGPLVEVFHPRGQSPSGGDA